MKTSSSIVLASKASRLRWLVLLLIVGSAFSADYFLKRDISEKVGTAWQEACDQSKSTLVCIERVASHHDECFDIAYTSMMLTFGRKRWESFKLLDYEACMNQEKSGTEKTIGI